MKSKQIVIWVCFGVISCVWLASGCSKVEPRQTVAEGESGSGEQPDESAFEFNLDIYLGTEIAEEPSKISDGHTLMRKDDRLFLAQSEPVLTEDDLRDVRIRRVPATGDEDNKQTSVVVFQLTEDAAPTLATLTGQNIGKHLVIVLNDEVLAGIPIKEKIADGKFRMPAEGLSEYQGEMLFMYPMLPFLRAMESAGIWEMNMEVWDRIDDDPARALELLETALAKVKDDPYLALWVRSQIIWCQMRRTDFDEGAVAQALDAAREALPDAAQVLRSYERPVYWFGLDPLTFVAYPLVVWSDDASPAELSQALTLIEFTIQRASEEIEAAQREGPDQFLPAYQSSARYGCIYAARAKARLGHASTAKVELEKVMGECVSPHELALTKYCLGKTLIESGRPQEAVKLLRHAWAHLDHLAYLLPSPGRPVTYKWLRQDIERMLDDIGEPVKAGPPEIIPGTAKIVVKARFRDGSKPLGAKCYIAWWLERGLDTARWALDAEGRPVPRTVVGGDGDWVIYNVPEGTWHVGVGGDDFPPRLEVNRPQLVEVKAGEAKSVTFDLLRAGSVTGRVVYADTGKAASGIRVSAGRVVQSDDTDAAGQYTIDRLAPGEAKVWASAENYVTGRSESIEVKDEATVVAPDIQLRRGGWISGRVVRPKDAPSDGTLRASLEPHFHGEPLSDVVIATEWVREREDYNLHFCLGPLPPGSYTVEANLHSGGKMLACKHWRGEVKGIRVQVGEQTGDVAIEVTLTNQ